jgi:hypothetical protein
MSIGATSIGEAAIAEQDGGASTSITKTKRPPKNRLVVAKADAVAQPEAR